MKPPRWDTANASAVREELMRRVENDASPSGIHRGGTRQRAQIARLGLAFAIALALIVPASIFALSQERVRVPAGTDPIAAGEDPVPTATAGSGQEPGAGLVGLWKVEAEGEGNTTWVAFTPRGVTVQRDRRLIYASWVTGDDRIGAVVGSWDGALTDHAVPWLEDAGTFAREGVEFVLKAPDGSVLASLTPAKEAPAPRGAAADSMSVSTSGSDASSAFALPVAPAVPGPALSPEELTGRWRTGDAAADGSRPFITFAADGTYRGSDGCNGISGKWLLLPGNRLVFTSSGRTQVGCGNLQPVPEWTEATRSVSVVSGALTLFDIDGKRLGSFDRR